MHCDRNLNILDTDNLSAQRICSLAHSKETIATRKTQNAQFSLGPIFKLLSVILIVITSALSHGTEINKGKEAAVKAAYLFNFTKFITYPDQAFSDKSAPYIIGLMGDDRIATILEKVVKDKKVNDRKLVIKNIAPDPDGKHLPTVKLCHILFIGKSESKQITELKESLEDTHVLTVSDSKDFADGEGHMEFKIKKKKIALRINLPATKKSKLKVSSKLLRLAEVVKE